MKKSNFSKGLLVGLLTFALSIVAFAAVKASADYPTVTFNFTVADTEDSFSWTTDSNVSSYTLSIPWSSKFKTAGNKSVSDLGYSPAISSLSNFTVAPENAVAYSGSGDAVTVPEGTGSATVTATVNLAPQDVVATTFNITIDDKVYTYTRAASQEIKYPVVSKETLLASAKNGGKSIADDYTGIALTLTTEPANTLWKYDSTSGNTTIKFLANEPLTLAFTATGTPKVAVPHYVNFTVKAPTGADGAYEDYTAKCESLSVKDNTATLADVLGLVEKAGEGDTKIKLEDASAWILDTREGKSKDLLKEDADVSWAAATGFKVKKDLTADKAVSLYVAPAKVDISFAVVVDEITYKSTFSVDNGAANKTKISYADIAAGLKAKVDDKEVVLAGQVVTMVGDKAQTGKYASSFYEVANNAIVDNFDDVEIEVIDAFTNNTGYDPDNDSLFFESPVELTVYWADVKKAAGATYLPKNFKSIDLKKADKNATTYTGSIPLNDKTAGVNIAVNKAAYIYASITAPATQKTKYTANYIVDATPYKKIAVTFAYAQADAGNEDCAIATITTTDTKKKTVVYSGIYVAEKNEDHYLFKAGVPSDTLSALQYSTDGKTWINVLGNPVDEKTGKQLLNLDLNKLYGYINGSAKTTLFFRIKGAEAVEAQEAVGTEGNEGYEPAVEAKNAYRAAKPVKAGIAIAKAGKAPKIDVSKGTIKIGNGYDVVITDNDKDTPLAEDAITILPFNKAGKASVTDKVEGVDVTIAVDSIWTSAYVPVAKVTEDDQMFTATKVKDYSIEKICEKFGADYYGTGNIYLWVRKSATAKKPADKWALVTIARVTAAPTVKADKSGYYSVQDPADTKGILATPEVSNANTDKNSGAYEYLIVDADDIISVDDRFVAKIDFSTAKWTTLTDKGLTVGKSKSKYSNETGKKASDHVLGNGSAVLIRRAGDKSSSILASNYITTMIVQENVTYKDAENKDQKKDLYVWKAFAKAAE